MTKISKSVKINMCVFGLLTIVLGGVLIAFPNTAVNIICMAIGGLLLLAGIISIVSYFKTKKIMPNGLSNTATLVLGILEGAVGTSILVNPSYFVNFLTVIFAVILLVHGINDLSKGINIKKMGYGNWAMPIIFGLIGIILSIIVFWNPFSTMNTLMILVGIALVLDGITEIVVGFMFSSSLKETEKNKYDAIDVDFEEVKDK